LEHYAKTSEVRPSPYLEIVQVALPYIEHTANDPYYTSMPAGCGLIVEQEIDMPTYAGGPSWKGYIDRVEALPDKGIVLDYKTTSDFRYARTPGELLVSPQMVSYAKWLADTSDYEEIWVKHLVLRMRGKAAAKLVEARITREQIETEWKKILIVVREMVSWGELGPETSDVLPPNTDHCSAYGGCYYRPKCGFEGQQLISIRRPTMSGTACGTSLLETMLKTASAVGVAAPAAAPVDPLAALMGAPAAPAPSPAPPVATDLTALLGMAAPAVVPTPPPAAAVAVPGILPPDAPSRVSTPEEVGPPPVVTSPVIVSETVPAVTAEGFPVAAPVASAPTEAPKKGRGRPRKVVTVEGMPAEAAPAAPAPTVEVIDPTKVTAEQAQTLLSPTGGVTTLGALSVAPPLAIEVEATKVVATPPAPAEASLEIPDAAFACGVETLFVDCMPQKGWPGDAPVWLDALMAAFMRLAAASAKQADYALIRYESKGYLRTAIRVLMSKLPKTVVVTTSTAGSAEFLECVTPYAKLIFRGIR
jgi:hypothetical protein